mmetsp:Transcript_14496/g.35333  ORF Transcript_14496/g.35333 Transcript_14496/m.35333 type:complete len:97 (+) Transcript_14496:878-1168(+)
MLFAFIRLQDDRRFPSGQLTARLDRFNFLDMMESREGDLWASAFSERNGLGEEWARRGIDSARNRRCEEWARPGWTGVHEGLMGMCESRVRNPDST